MSTSIGEPISGGQAPRGWDELSIRFDDGMDLGKIRALLQQAKERGGIPGETVSAFNLAARGIDAPVVALAPGAEAGWSIVVRSEPIG